MFTKRPGGVVERSLGSRRAWPAICALLLAAAALGACSRNSIIIPTQSTAAEQYKYAYRLEKQFHSPFEKDRSEPNYERTLTAYRKVLEAFPDDPVWVPLARLRMAIVMDTHTDYRGALKIYEDLIEKHPNNDPVLIQSLYGAAVIYDRDKDFDKAMDAYNQILDRFGKSEIPQFRRLVQRSHLRYQKVRER